MVTLVPLAIILAILTGIFASFGWIGLAVVALVFWGLSK